jgi:hypothetical protein
MPGTVVFLMVFIISVLVIFGVLIKHYKCYWLIAGYNTTSDIERKNVDIVGLSRFMGNICFVLAAVLLVGSVLNYFGIIIGLYISIGSILFIVPFMVISTRKYYNKTANTGSSGNVIKTVIFCVIVFILVAAMIFYGTREPRIDIDHQKISISGIYGTDISIESVTNIYIKDTIPKVLKKTNGFDFGNILRGNFSLEDTDAAKLYVYRGKHPYIYIERDTGLIIINFKDSRMTKEVYKDLEEIWSK